MLQLYTLYVLCTTIYLCKAFARTKVVEKVLMNSKNSKLFEQKGDLLSFKVNIDPKSGLMLSCVELS